MNDNNIIQPTFRVVSHYGGAYGKFEGYMRFDWIHDGTTPDRDMRVVSDLTFTNAAGNMRFVAPAGSIVNGASIPRFFWRFVGPPFVGRYRLASVVHDVLCIEQKHPPELVHEMFYWGCLAGGCSKRHAGWLRWAVAKFGPRW